MTALDPSLESGAAAMLKQSPWLTVVIPTFNRPALLTSLLDSLAVQDTSMDTIEVVVVDNGSIVPPLDGRHYPFNLTYIRNVRNHLPTAFNLGAEHATAPFVAYVDDDVSFPPTWLRQLRAVIAAHPEAGAWGGPAIELGFRKTRALLERPGLVGKIVSAVHDRVLMEGRGGVIGAISRYGAYSTKQFDSSLAQSQSDAWVNVDQLSTVNVVIRREILAKVGGFCHGFHQGYSDGDLFLRLRGQGIPLVACSSPYVYHHIGEPAPNRDPYEQARNFDFFIRRMRARDSTLKTYLGQRIVYFAFLLVMLRYGRGGSIASLKGVLGGWRDGTRDYRQFTQISQRMHLVGGDTEHLFPGNR